MSNTRVRKPPGGDSSFNIFGISNEPNDKKKTDNQTNTTAKIEDEKTDVTVAIENNENPVLTEATNETDEKKGEDEETKEPEQQAAETTSSESIESKETTINNENQNSGQDTKNKSKAAAYNPITGEAYGSPESKQESQTGFGPTRVRQPPGGASSKLW